jgi:hypothetical protein
VLRFKEIVLKDSQHALFLSMNQSYLSIIRFVQQVKRIDGDQVPPIVLMAGTHGDGSLRMRMTDFSSSSTTGRCWAMARFEPARHGAPFSRRH